MTTTNTIEGERARRYSTDADGADCGMTRSLEKTLKHRERELTEAEARTALGARFPEEQTPPDLEGRTVTLKAGTPIRNTFDGSQRVGHSAECDFSGIARRVDVPVYVGPDIRWYRIYGAEGHETGGYAVLAEDLVVREPDLADRVEAHGFECEAGPLSRCEDWQQLVREYRRLTERHTR